MKFATEPKPNHFHGEDVIGDELYQNNSSPIPNRIPQQLLSKLQQQPMQPSLSAISNEYEEEFNINQPLQVTYNSPQQQETITKNIKINLEINLKINVI